MTDDKFKMECPRGTTTLPLSTPIRESPHKFYKWNRPLLILPSNQDLYNINRWRFSQLFVLFSGEFFSWKYLLLSRVVVLQQAPFWTNEHVPFESDRWFFKIHTENPSRKKNWLTFFEQYLGRYLQWVLA